VDAVILARADDGVHWSPPNVEFDVQLEKRYGSHRVKWKTARTVQQSGLDQWGTYNPQDPNSPPAATLMYNFLLAFPDHPDLVPAVLTFQRSALKSGKKFNTKLATIMGSKTHGYPMFGLVFQFSSFQDSNAVGQTFYNVQATGYGKITDPVTYNDYKNMYETFAQTGLNIKDIEDVQTEGAADPEAGPAEQPAF